MASDGIRQVPDLLARGLIQINVATSGRGNLGLWNTHLETSGMPLLNTSVSTCARLTDRQNEHAAQGEPLPGHRLATSGGALTGIKSKLALTSQMAAWGRQCFVSRPHWWLTSITPKIIWAAGPRWGNSVSQFQ